jgi:hypothetical protein
MAQNSRAPVFALGAKDGVVGSHFLKVRELKETFKSISKNLQRNLNKIKVD